MPVYAVSANDKDLVKESRLPLKSNGFLPGSAPTSPQNFVKIDNCRRYFVHKNWLHTDR